MTILELYQKGFNAAVEELAEQHDDITTYENLKEFIKLLICQAFASNFLEFF